MDRTQWQFWIDVGGTFTDCLGIRPNGARARHKTLSSGTVPGMIDHLPDSRTVADPTRIGEPDGVWAGYYLRVQTCSGVSASGDVALVEASDGARGTLTLNVLPHGLEQGMRYELFSDESAPVIAMRYVAGIGRHGRLPRAMVRLGTTRGTNALLTRTGARTALITNQGFRDVCRIGYQERSDLFALDIEKTQPLVEQVVEIAGRTAADGEQLEPLNESTLRRQLRTLYQDGIEALAVCLIHSCARPDHELEVARVAREVGFRQTSLSHQVAPIRKLVPRMDTSQADAYLTPLLGDYLSRIHAVLEPTENVLKVMTSAGGLVSPARFSGKDSILSGPAGGVVGYARVAETAGFSQAIGFDMGGTSTDVSRFDGQFDREYETQKAGIRLVAPMMAIETVAAGGGSVCRFDGVKLAVGPQSAGADPGPACYGRGGPLTVTDMNYLLGRLLSSDFPFSLDLPAVQRKMQQTVAQVNTATKQSYSPYELAAGFLRVANTHMSQAIRSVSLAKGVHPKDYVLVAFGGAAPQHACPIARELGMSKVLVPAEAGILSALGIGLAPVSRYLTETVHRRYNLDGYQALLKVWDSLVVQGRQQVRQEGIADDQMQVMRSLHVRYEGVDATVTVAAPQDGDLRRAFETVHHARYGYVHQDRPLEIVAAQVEVIGSAQMELPRVQEVDVVDVPADRQELVWFEDEFREVGVYQRAALPVGGRIVGPGLIAETHSLVVVEPDWQVDVLSDGQLLLTDRAAGTERSVEVGTSADPVMLEVYNRNFAGIATQMGVTLQNTATSVNVKERLDYSCALFDSDGNLVVNAPHMPVHLGAMSQTVKHVIRAIPDLHPGDVIVTNDPYQGGSHLPDVTVVTPCHDVATQQLMFFTASRAHHAEIGGILPGSMPPFSKHLGEEGVVIPPMRIVDAGQPCFEVLRDRLSAPPFPSRNVEHNLADISAQIAANQQGVKDLRALSERFGWPVLRAYMRHIQTAAAHKAKLALLDRIGDATLSFRDEMDDGTPIAVKIFSGCDKVVIDFSGTGPVSPGNLNANRAITTAAVLYATRCLINEDIPLNAGVLDPVEIVLPVGLLNPQPGSDPESSPAVVGGNVETSQRIVDVLLGALELGAASQGTMNNLLFGNARFGYYETICGGAGATCRKPGASAVHTHMTNTRLTDPEVLETRFPVRLRRFVIRQGSGGTGRLRGGDGVVRELEFLTELDVSLLTQRRRTPPYGVGGGGPGACGKDWITRANGRVEPLEGIAHVRVVPGDVLTVCTPGGGGWGTPENENPTRA